ncbi:MAG: squalene synthase HpnC [Rhodospirillales bacterium]
MIQETEPGGAAKAVETPSGKDAAYENFPVGSFLLPKKLRPHIRAFYAFARAIDDIADEPSLNSGEKILRLDGFARAVEGKEDGEAFAKGAAMRDSLAATGVAAGHCLDLISAFKQDAVKSRYKNWDDLMNYCVRSAAPVGRYLIDLHGCDARAYAQSDALCNALQVINHMQDCGDDFRTLNRVYLPADWMAEAGAEPEDLTAPAATPAMRAVLDRCTAAARALMVTARPLAPALSDRRLAMESAVIIRIADALLNKLSHGDPLAGRVKLNAAEYAGCAVRGAAAGLSGRP